MVLFLQMEAAQEAGVSAVHQIVLAEALDSLGPAERLACCTHHPSTLQIHGARVAVALDGIAGSQAQHEVVAEAQSRVERSLAVEVVEEVH